MEQILSFQSKSVHAARPPPQREESKQPLLQQKAPKFVIIQNYFLAGCTLQMQKLNLSASSTHSKAP